jgi:hypothetical protein
LSTPISSRPRAMRPFPPRRVSGLLLLFAFVLNLGGVVMYAAGIVEPSTPYAWERAGGDPYYPILHAIPLLMISIPLIRPERRLSSPAGVTASPISGE